MSGPSPSPPADGPREPETDPPGGLPAKLKEIAATALVTGGVTTLFAVLTDGVRARGGALDRGTGLRLRRQLVPRRRAPGG
ncbi:hypothetical protein [Streptosporangium sp. CA-115845]|uniref:hypothetical protein n=1 Tax=Streptosporangium sp. CA-115845 TaxID=3240071 RepID=UPI003D949B09